MKLLLIKAHQRGNSIEPFQPISITILPTINYLSNGANI